VSQRLTHRPPTEPGRKPARPAPEPEQVALAARRSMQLGVAMVLTMLPTFASFPARMLTIPFGVVAVVLGIRAIIAGVRARSGGLLVPAVAAGTVLAAVFTLSVASTVLVWDIQDRDARCRAEAITVQARIACQDRLDADLESWRDGLLDRARGGSAD